MLKLLMLSDYFPPHFGGGVERAAFEVSRRVAAAGHQVTVLTTNSRRAAEHEQLEGIEVLRVPSLDLTRVAGIQLALSVHAWFAIRRILAKGEIDLVHVHGLFFHLSLAGSFLAQRYKVPLVTTAHVGAVSDLGGGYGRLSALYERTIGKQILQRSAEVIAVSQAVSRHLSSLGCPDDQITVIPNGVDSELFSPPVDRPRKGTRVLFVGRLIFNKGPQFILEAIPGVLNRFPNAEFWFIGEGPMQRDLERRVSTMGLARDKVRFLGNRDDVPALLADGDILVRPSLLEGLPLTVLEGMAAGLPVVATPVGGTAELVEDGVNGYLVEPGNIDQLSGRICDLLADQNKRQQMGRSGRLTAARGYDWDDVSRRTVDVYLKAIASKQMVGAGRSG